MGLKCILWNKNTFGWMRRKGVIFKSHGVLLLWWNYHVVSEWLKTAIHPLHLSCNPLIKQASISAVLDTAAPFYFSISLSLLSSSLKLTTTNKHVHPPTCKQRPFYMHALISCIQVKSLRISTKHSGPDFHPRSLFFTWVQLYWFQCARSRFTPE